uniref:Helitron helicase-like domain-containing protein n=1 Tax=Panagrolaimus superbus TaxID=310955 RepID=A0A914YBH3_9BILA
MRWNDKKRCPSRPLSLTNNFLDGKFGRRVSTRTIPISDIKWIKNRVNHISRQYNDPEFLMFLKSFKDTKALFGAVGITFREIKDVLNVTDLIKTFQQERYSVIMDSALTTKFRSLRGSIDYFNTVEKELQCVVDTIGPAAFYITANPSPEDWENLRRTYLTIYSNISEMDYNCDKMIAKDPVIFSTYFRNRLHNLLRNVILNKDGPFGELIHHFFRIDYQESNLTHCHMIFWSKNEVTLEKLGGR